MKIEVKVTRLLRLDGEGALKAFADISLDDEIVVLGLRILEGKVGLFVCMPREAGKDGKWYESIRPMSKEIRNALNDIIIKAFRE